MSAALGDDEFYQNLLQYMNQNTQGPSSGFLSPSPLAFSPHEAEKRTLDTDDSMPEDNDTKRRESTNSNAMDSGSDEAEQKPKKKPGRKMMTTEPANKRKAQNRAAQRAFRERKEAHVKGLESRVTELEELTQSKDVENAALKSQVQSLQAELMTLRGGNFNFDFSTQNMTNGISHTANVRNPFQTQQQTGGQTSSPSPSSGSITDSSRFRSGQSSLATSPDNDVNKNKTPNIDIPFDLFSNTTAGPVTFTSNSNQTTPLFSTDLFGNTSNQSSPVFTQPQTTQRTSPILDSFAATLASLTQGQSLQNLSNGFNSVPPTSASPLSSFTPSAGGNLFDMNDPLFNTWRDNSISSTDDNTFDIFDTMFQSMSPGAFNFVDTTGLTDFITDSPINIPSTTPSTGAATMTCPELLEKVQNNPQYEDIDIDTLCAEMRSKAKCSNSGPVFAASDVDETISRLAKKDDSVSPFSPSSWVA